MEQQRASVALSSLAYGGEAVGRIGGKVVFVPFGAPGDLATVAITEDRGRFARARIVSIERAGANRREPRCRYFTRCGGCSWQHVDYSAQLTAKEEALREAFRRIARLDAPINAIVPSSAEFGYRSRTRLQVGASIGYFAAASDEIVDIESCPLLEPALDEELRRVRAQLHASGAHGTHDAAGAPRGGEAPASSERVRAAGRRELELELDDAGVVRSAWRTASGDGALGFRQANRSINELLRAFVRERAGSTVAAAGAPAAAPGERAQGAASAATEPGRRTVIDLFCGNGNLSLPIARDGARVIGIDSSPGSIAQARAGARGLDADYRCEDVGAIGGALRALARGADCLIVDPPRKGLERFAAELARLAVPLVLYVSCAPPTLARDVRVFAEHGYAVREVQPFDMFPQTYHVESVAVLACS